MEEDQQRYNVDRSGYWVEAEMNKQLQVIRMKYRPLTFNIVHTYTRMFYCHGQFVCYQCDKKNGRDWGTGMGAIQIGLTISQAHSDSQYSEAEDDQEVNERFLHQFSLKGYRQRCQICDNYASLQLTIPNLKNLLRTVDNFLENKRHNKQFKDFPRNKNNSRSQHLEALCQACARGVCRIRRARKQKQERRSLVRDRPRRQQRQPRRLPRQPGQQRQQREPVQIRRPRYRQIIRDRSHSRD